MPERPFAEYLTESLAKIARDAPRLYALVARRLGPRSLKLAVGGEALGIRAEGEQVVLGPPMDQAGVEARTSRRAIVALADGEDDLEGAIVAERVFLRGSVEDLEACFGALAAYLNGAARSPEQGELMRAFRRDAGEDEGYGE
ncbi:hypothetical protein WME76_12325 [Sorangium sp. So ce119]|uniref:hypothetical protein n=1 Tax=Sorangium sp. So ce119 TaxID=3133279 RepID=UPI003F60335B